MSLLNLSNRLTIFLRYSEANCHSRHILETPKILKNIRYYSSTEKIINLSDKMTERLRIKFPLAKHIEVVDISGGCGSMYEIYVETVEFKGLSMVKQHRLINEVLKEDIKQMHGLRISTKVPEEVR